eukprot:174087_1
MGEELAISGIEISTIYFFINQFLLIIFSIYLYLTGEHKNIKEFLKTVWKRKWIYAEVTAHLYDTASDIGVLVEWYFLAYDGIEYSINMEAMFWASIIFQILYRILLCGFSTVGFGYRPDDDEASSCGGCMWSTLLSWTDMYIIKTVYVSMKYGETEPNERQKSIGIIEAVAESAPQIILQCIFLARSYADPELSESDSSLIVIISLVASIFSISRQFAELDENSVTDEAKELGFDRKKWPCINFWYVVRVFWRFNFLLARMFMLVAIWLVLGGGVFAIFLGISTVMWCCCLCRLTDTGDCYGSGNYYVCCIACIGNPITRDFKVNCYHFCEMITWIIIITILGFTNDMDLYDDNCGDLCGDKTDRIATGNPYTQGFIIIAWISMVIDFILFFVLYYTEVFQAGLLDDIFEVFIDGQKYSPKVNKEKREKEEAELEEERTHNIELEVDTAIVTEN